MSFFCLGTFKKVVLFDFLLEFTCARRHSAWHLRSSYLCPWDAFSRVFGAAPVHQSAPLSKASEGLVR